jgi:hypothetical protein
MTHSRWLLLASTILIGSALSGSAFAGFIEGSGHYGIRAKSHVNQGFADNTLYQAADQSFRLNAEVRATDQTSFFAAFSIFPDPMSAHLGDRTGPQECYGPNGATSGEACKNAYQNTSEPGYQPLVPQLTEAYGQYAFEYCLLQAGRRPRDWGLGIFMDSGHRPFSKARTVYDGVTCNINIQKSQTLGFSVGYDKLAESGGSIAPNITDPITDGAAKRGDDLDQFFFSIEFDDRKANAGAAFTRAVKIYFANVVSSKGKNDPAASQTDVKFADLFTGFYFYDLLFENEVLFRLGKSADPSWARLGGVASYKANEATGAQVTQYGRNNVESIGLAGHLKYTLSRSGAAIGPEEYNQGSLTRHSVFLGYAYAPGDNDGYEDPNGILQDGKVNKRSSKAQAMAFHKNFQPALILLNDTAIASGQRIDGVFDPERVMNATVLSGGYRYESQQNGNFELKLIGAYLNAGMPGTVKQEWASVIPQASADNPISVPVGYYGKDLGYELDLKYDRSIGKDVNLGGAIAYALPGDAWRTNPKKAVSGAYLLQTHVNWNF